MKIGYVLSNYPEKRCIIGRTENTYVYFNIKRSISYLIKALLQRLGIYNAWDVKTCLTVPSGQVDVWHTFNEIVKTKDPFVVTFESAVPRSSETLERRWEWDSTYQKSVSLKTKRQIKRLYKNNCKKLLALSHNAVDVMRYQLEKLKVEPNIMAGIMDKVEVLYPPQALNCTAEEVREKYRSAENRLELIFVGNDFFRKGGGYASKGAGAL